MAKIYNSDVTRELARNAGIQQSREKTPDELAEKVVPTFETNVELFRKNNFINEVHRSATSPGTSIIKTCALGKRTFLTSVYIYMLKDAACDKASGELALTITPRGKASISIFHIPIITLTAQESNVVMNMPPIELEPNTGIILGTFAYAAGTAANGATIAGYEIDNANA